MKTKKPQETNWVDLLLIGMLGLMIGVFFTLIIIESGSSDAYTTTQDCNETVLNVSYGVYINMLESITQEAMQCNPISVSYESYEYTLVALECLNLNGEPQNG